MRYARSREISLCVVCCALYAALVNVFAPISFQQVQVRVANALIGLVPLLGWPAICGLALGVFFGNLASPLGLIDLLSVLPSFLGLVAVYRLRGVSVLLGLQAYSTVVSAWVAYMLKLVFSLPYMATFIYVLLGVSVATTGLGYLLYKSLSRLGVARLLSGAD
ncbi:MAG: QueT transporter family protein [Candidatus Bathyarchaeia archaeon]